MGLPILLCFQAIERSELLDSLESFAHERLDVGRSLVASAGHAGSDVPRLGESRGHWLRRNAGRSLLV